MKGYPEGSPQTVKEAGTAGALARGEWETELDGTTPDLAKTKKTPLEKLTAKKLHRKLKPIFRTSVRRMTQPIRTRRSEIELAVDRGSITSGRRSRPISEFPRRASAEASLGQWRILCCMRSGQLAGGQGNSKITKVRNP